MTETLGSTERPQDLENTQLARGLRTLGAFVPESQKFIEEAADRIDRLDRLSRLLGLLAPAGTAPRTALAKIYEQSADPTLEESPIVLDLRHMLAQHWDEWTPALREAEGLPAADVEQV